MESSKLLIRSKIIFLYNYFILKRNEQKFRKWIDLLKVDRVDENIQNVEWFWNFKGKEEVVIENINKSLKSGWEFLRIPDLEKTILAISCYEIISSIDKKRDLSIINKALEVSKRFLDEGRYKYINSVLDSIMKRKYL